MITIKEVLTKKDLKVFVEFPNKLYKDNPYYVPSLTIDELQMFNKKKNPAYSFSKTKLFLAYHGKRVVGRIAGLINYAYNIKVNKPLMRFTRFDVIDDIEVSKALFNEVVKWAKENDLKYLMGPIGFTDIDKQGMLVKGFDELNMTITLYNHNYYNKHLKELGFIKDADWVEYQVRVPKEIDPKIKRVAEVVKKRYGFYVVEIKKRKELYHHAKPAFELVNEAYEKLYGTVYLTDEIIAKAVKEYVPLVNLDYVYIINNKHDEIVGFGLALPSYANALKKSKGKLFPLGLFRILKDLKKSKVLEMYLVAVKPEYQNMGVSAIIMNEAFTAAIKNNIEFAETGPELELNEQVRSLWKTFDAREHKLRRSYLYEIKD